MNSPNKNGHIFRKERTFKIKSHNILNHIFLTDFLRKDLTNFQHVKMTFEMFDKAVHNFGKSDDDMI